MKIKKIIYVCGVLFGVYFLSFFGMRLAMQNAFLPPLSELRIDEVFALYKMGALLDMRAICPILLVLLVLFYVGEILKIATQATQKLFPKIKSHIYIHNRLFLLCVGACSFLVIFSALGNFYYFKTYHTKIDIFIFGFKDDDATAILKIIWQEYPVLVILLACMIYALLCVRITHKILLARDKFCKTRESAKPCKNFKTIFVLVLAHLLTIALLIIGARGSVGTFPLREDSHQIFQLPALNHIATNPILAFSWALGHYIKQEKLQVINDTKSAQLQKELFPVFSHNVSSLSPKIPPNVVFVLMESFGTNMLSLDSQKDFDLLGAFRFYFESGKKHQQAQQDFTFTKFLSHHNGTASSFASIFFNAPLSTISLSRYKNKMLALTPMQVYKNAGYKVIFITSGNRAWHNLGDYLLTQGVDSVFDSGFLLSHYPASRQSQNTYGVSDEFAYKLAFELLDEAQEPLFIFILTTTNHPPFSLPAHFIAPQYNLESKKEFFKTTDEAKMRLISSVFTYSSNAFGEFIAQVRHSALQENTIIAASGDHMCRDIATPDNLALAYGVPLYLSIPHTIAKNLDFNPNALGSHKDIFPTLYALSLKEYDYISLGGRNLFEDSKNLEISQFSNFAYNDALLITPDFILPNGAMEGIAYEIKGDFIIPTSQKVALPQEFTDFFTRSKELDWWQLGYRLLK
ncbi:LTA synthase family protein [Helicobacter himalayensis]|uniref:LTA synthase family protein n=1 Tax=Helicobacter himalayensis TaxID=1591088 RepID=UPI0008331F75|nr:LTA synthase family protein [Helicobacter himalayensis]